MMIVVKSTTMNVLEMTEAAEEIGRGVHRWTRNIAAAGAIRISTVHLAHTVTEARNTVAAIGHNPQLKTNTKTTMHIRIPRRSLMVVHGASTEAIKTSIVSDHGIGIANETARTARIAIATTTTITSDLATRTRIVNVEGIARRKRMNAITTKINIVLRAAAGKSAIVSDRVGMTGGILRSTHTRMRGKRKLDRFKKTARKTLLVP
jgi:hypothetical protein